MPKSQTAVDAISLIRCTRNQLTRMTALVGAIRLDALQGQAVNISVLTDMALHLGEDWGSYLDRQVEVLQAQLDALQDNE